MSPRRMVQLPRLRPVSRVLRLRPSRIRGSKILRLPLPVVQRIIPRVILLQ